MKFDVPWSVKGVRPEALETADEAARRSGMSLGDWLNSVIIQQAGQAGVPSPPLVGDDFHAGEFAAPNHRLDDRSQPVEPKFACAGPAAYAPKRSRNESDQFASMPPAPPPEIPNVRLPPSLDRAVAEIAARQRTLNDNAPAPRRQPQAAVEIPAPPPRPLPAQNLSGLEDQLRNITNQIETLREPGVEQAINALREELGAISRTLSDAMPRRALEAIEKQIRSLDQRIAEGRQAGIDAAALGGIEHGLAEVRDAMRGLMPAENLIGYTDAVANLAHKIDLIVAQNDPATIAQLERSIITLREMTNHIASNETVRGLAAQVQALGEKIDYMAHASATTGDGAFTHLEQRIALLSDTLAERAHSGTAVSPRLEALVESLAEKIERLQNSRGNGDAFGHLEDRIVKLVEKLDASDSRFGHLEGVERGLADLLVHIEDMRAKPDAGGLRAQGAPAVDDLKHDIARTQDALEAVHGTLGHVVDRLATIEKDIRGQVRPRGAPDGDAAFVQPAFADDAPSIAAPMQPLAAPPPAPLAPPTQRRMPPAAQLPNDSDLPDNQPLEPGSGPPNLQGNPAARIAASEAALAGTPPAVAPGGKSSFIAAARRAAQAAGQQPNARAPRAEPVAGYEPANTSLSAKVIKRVKSLFIAASIIAIVVGAVQIAGNVLDFGNSITKMAEAPAPAPVVDTAKTEAEDHDTAPDTTASIAAKPFAPPAPPGVGSLTPAPGGSTIAGIPPLGMNQMPPAIPSLFGPPVFGTKDDITGSIPRPAGDGQAAHPATPVTPSVRQPADQLPVAIGGPKLRSAAIAGDAAAAYSVAVRFAEGRGVPVDLEQAAHWYERAASKGLAPAQFRYASLLEKGLGVKKDLAQARRLYLAAAIKGNSKAMHNLAVLYAEGIDGKPDYATAVQWFRKAAQHGIADSQYNLGVLCARGLGTDRSYDEAYKWFALAAAQGDRESAKKRDDVAAQLDASALATAQQAVKNFVAEPQSQEAVTVREPPGGWDHAAGAPPHANPRATGPLALGTFQVGKQ
jgi:localization factor PodJL